MAFLGMRGTGDWVPEQRPKSFREAILYLYPNGHAPLTAILSMMPSEEVNDPEFKWWTKELPDQSGTVTNVYDDSGLSAASSGGESAETVRYVNVSEATARNFKKGHQVLLRDETDLSTDVPARVQEVVLNGSSSYLRVYLLTAVDDLASINWVGAIGSMYPEGDEIPDEVGYDVEKHRNYTQIFRTSLSITRTARKTKLRTGEAKEEMVREALELHSIEMERAFMWSAAYEGQGDNSKPERSTEGIITQIRRPNRGGHTFDFVNDNGGVWSGDGEDWFDESLEVVFRKGRPEKLALCGSQALLGINKLAKSGGAVNLRPMSASYGLKVVEWVTPSVLSISWFTRCSAPSGQTVVVCLSLSRAVCGSATLMTRFIRRTTASARTPTTAVIRRTRSSLRRLALSGNTRLRWLSSLTWERNSL